MKNKIQKIKLIRLILIPFCFIILSNNKVFCDGDIGSFFGATVGGDFVANSNDVGISPDFNMLIVLCNFGMNTKIIRNNIPSVNFYIGFGYLNLFQIQGGSNYNDNITGNMLIRIQSFLPIFAKSMRWGDARENNKTKINLHIFWEYNHFNSREDNGGIGICYLIM